MEEIIQKKKQFRQKGNILTMWRVGAKKERHLFQYYKDVEPVGCSGCTGCKSTCSHICVGCSSSAAT